MGWLEDLNKAWKTHEKDRNCKPQDPHLTFASGFEAAHDLYGCPHCPELDSSNDCPISSRDSDG